MANDEWETPLDLFNPLNKSFEFNRDVCASEKNALLDKYWTMEDSALDKRWSDSEMHFMNPPYSKIIAEFLEKAHNETLENNAKTLALIPANVGTKYFNNYCFDGEAVVCIYFIEGRLKYTLNGKPVGSPRFDSCLVWFLKNHNKHPRRIEFYKTDRQFSYVEKISC
jgi:phage N-6-adenine-methyltransferase